MLDSYSAPLRRSSVSGCCGVCVIWRSRTRRLLTPVTCRPSTSGLPLAAVALISPSGPWQTPPMILSAALASVILVASGSEKPYALAGWSPGRGEQ